MSYISLDNLILHYEKSGKGEPLIFLCGMFLDLRLYKEIISILEKHYTVYAIDLPMHGKSGKLKENVSILGITILLKQFLDKLEIKNPTICAHSGGSIVAIEYASIYNPKELILMEPAGITLFLSKFKLLFSLNRSAINSFIRNPIKAPKLFFVGTQNVLKNLFNKPFWALIDRNLYKSYKKEMNKITCPVTLLWTKTDLTIPFKDEPEYERSLKHAKLITVDGNHNWPIILPKELLKFFNRT